MTLDEEVFEVYAIRFAHNAAGIRSDHFYSKDPHGSDSHPIDYFVWLAKSAEHTVMIDAGYTAATALRRGREYLRSPVDSLAAMGIDAATEVTHLIISHLHWDHIGHVPDFPAARIVLQEAEMAFWTGRHAGRGDHARTLEPGDIVHILERNWQGNVRMVNGDHTVVPGITVHLVGGHTPGMQVTRVKTRSGYLVLASDASHYYENIEADRPFSIVNNLPGMYDAFDRINELADSPALVIPGHDPEVMEHFPLVPDPAFEKLVIRLD